MVTIRPYQEKDYEYVRAICMGRAEPPETIDEGTLKSLIIYFDYYVEQEPQNCFVAEGDGKLLGYVICAEDYRAYAKKYKRVYMPRIRKYGIKASLEARESTLAHRILARKYPAHLHIDVLDGYRSLGLGSKLIDALCEHLKSSGVKGLMLTVAPKNKRGAHFYEKYGFKLIGNFPGAITFGIKL
ncbi:MAG: GNAT family N-acetyltransferase [Oscillospiraceae bacterium]|nr:GNAT family N-acetyltransferase [Oscillospiraceae bacterium]